MPGDLRQGIQGNRRCRTANDQSRTAIEENKLIQVSKSRGCSATLKIAHCNMLISNSFQKTTVEDQFHGRGTGTRAEMKQEPMVALKRKH
jgi:hypothetical protein